jgi:hypothetical protein
MRKVESLLEQAQMAVYSKDIGRALNAVEEARLALLIEKLTDERDQIRREMAMSDLRTLREMGL